MLGSENAIATAAVRDIEVARRFYEEKVGLTPVDTQEHGTVSYTSGQSKFFVYQSQYAGTNRATAVTWIVGEEFDNIVHTLADRGVAFEHYDDLPHTVRDGDVHITGELRLAWFKDPDGNIHGLVNGAR